MSQQHIFDIGIERISLTNSIELKENGMELFLISLVAAVLTGLLLLTVASVKKTLEKINQATGGLQTLTPSPIPSRWER